MQPSLKLFEGRNDEKKQNNTESLLICSVRLTDILIFWTPVNGIEDHHHMSNVIIFIYMKLKQCIILANVDILKEIPSINY